MTKRGLFGVAGMLSLTMAGAFVYSPVFAEGPVDIRIVEMGDDGAGNLISEWQDIIGAMPGMTYNAVPRIQNNGTVAASVRMCLSESGMDATGNTIELDDGTFTIDINDSYWTLDAGDDNDGAVNSPIDVCYKYNAELGAGEVTEPLFSEVTLSSELGNEHGGATFNLHLYAEATGDLPDKPDTGAATLGGSSIKADYIFYGLGAAAIFVFILHLILGLVKRK